MTERIVEEEPPEHKENHLFSLSVGVLLSIPQSRGSLVLVQQNSGEWGLPAGGVEPRESYQVALVREVEEETGIKRDKIFFRGGIIFTEQGKVYSEQSPKVMCVITDDKTSIGLVYEAYYHGPKLAKNGWDISGDNKIVKAKPFSIRELVQLAEGHMDNVSSGNEELLYRPDFNFHAILGWIVKNSCMYGERTRYLNEWLDRNQHRLPGLSKTQSTSTGWFYDTGAEIIQDNGSVKRVFGLKWGE